MLDFAECIRNKQCLSNEIRYTEYHLLWTYNWLFEKIKMAHESFTPHWYKQSIFHPLWSIFSEVRRFRCVWNMEMRSIILFRYIMWHENIVVIHVFNLFRVPYNIIYRVPLWYPGSYDRDYFNQRFHSIFSNICKPVGMFGSFKSKFPLLNPANHLQMILSAIAPSP